MRDETARVFKVLSQEFADDPRLIVDGKLQLPFYGLATLDPLELNREVSPRIKVIAQLEHLKDAFVRNINELIQKVEAA